MDLNKIPEGPGELEKFIESLDEEHQLGAHVTIRLAVLTSLLEAASVGLYEIAKQSREEGFVPEVHGFVIEAMADTLSAEVKKTEEMVEMWEVVYDLEI